ncbi:microsomal epoxide hydrolase [Paenibacillus montaniterrae]|uniref:Microsomal epoxide hydrolase n=1 Tax=Paenibacillus montaniterrae TaxID=429341 RepID=A0A919YR04_9BACL|nr:epoxide hydrolase family protein [Paenibacillus montaniterrae]GIP17697.1 microsomal epoxide hydrolase [Paenibacillus montaniterrae]
MNDIYQAQHKLNDERIQPFRVHVSQEDIDDLKRRLDRSRYPQLVDTGWERGVPLAYLQELAAYWQHQFDWRKQEAFFNQFPHYITTIEGQNIHFLHIRSQEPNAKPLMLIHGWPGSFIEFLYVIEPLTNPIAHGGSAEDAFHLVIPSIPGFGFSSPLQESGWTPARMAGAFLELMSRLGYEHFGVQGGDTGAFIAPEMGKQAPERLVGVHMNAMFTFPTGEEGELEGLSEEELQRLSRMESFNDGYMQIQSKSPNTLAYGLHDSPVSQLAWIAEIFKQWTAPEEAMPEAVIDRDRMLSNVSLYWFSGTAWSSAQVYYESMHDPMAWAPKEKGTVPTGVLVSTSHDMSVRRLAEKDHNIMHWTEAAEGGHFFAMEQPAQFVKDLRQFFRSLS